MAGNRQMMSAVGHADVFALSNNFKPCFGEGLDDTIRSKIRKEH